MNRRLRIVIICLLACLAAAAPARASSLKDARWLRAAGGRVMVLDIRPARAFAAGHVPGALNIPFSAPLWRETRHGVAGYLPAPEKLAAALGAYGLSRAAPLIVVSAGGSPRAVARAARVFWALRVLGHEKLWLLDGGMKDWRGELQRGPPPPRHPAAYVPRPDFSILATLERTQDALDNNIPPIDARDMDHFYGYANDLGEEDGGTILDAVNVPAGDLLRGPAARFAPPAALRAAFAERGATLDQGLLVTFSTHGVMAAADWFALREILGLPARLYDGSLAEWAAEGMDLYDSTDGMGGVIGG